MSKEVWHVDLWSTGVWPAGNFSDKTCDGDRSHNRIYFCSKQLGVKRTLDKQGTASIARRHRKNWKRIGKDTVHRGNIKTIRVVNFDAKRHQNYFEGITSQIEAENYEITIISNAKRAWIDTWKEKGWLTIWIANDIVIVGNSEDVKEGNEKMILGKGKNQVVITGINLPSATVGGLDSKSIRDTMDDRLEEAIKRLDNYDKGLIIGQTETRDPRWSLNERPVDNTRIETIRKWERRNRVLKLIEGDKDHPVREPGKLRPSTHKAGWSKNVDTTGWITTRIEGLSTTKAQVCEIMFNSDDDAQDEDDAEETAPTVDNEEIYSITSVTTDPAEVVRVLQADAGRAKINMRRVKGLVSRKEYDIIIITRPDVEELRDWELQWDVIRGCDTAIVIINRYMQWREIESSDKLGAAIELGMKGKACRMRTINLEPRKKEESYTKKGRRIQRRMSKLIKIALIEL